VWGTTGCQGEFGYLQVVFSLGKPCEQVTRGICAGIDSPEFPLKLLDAALKLHALKKPNLQSMKQTAL